MRKFPYLTLPYLGTNECITSFFAAYCYDSGEEGYVSYHILLLQLALKYQRYLAMKRKYAAKCKNITSIRLIYICTRLYL